MDFKEIKELIRVFDKSELNKLKVREGNFEVAMQKGFENGTLVTTSSAPIAPAATTLAPAIPTINETPLPANTSGDTINSPMVGTFYAAPSPEAPPFVKVGDTVKKGQTLCILEAMKIMNEVEAEFNCKIVDILIQDATPVEYDMPMFVIEKL